MFRVFIVRYDEKKGFRLVLQMTLSSEEMVFRRPGFVSPLSFRNSQRHDELGSKVENLDPTEDGEAGEEPHGAADEANLSC